MEKEKQEVTWGGIEELFATEVIEQSKRTVKHWFLAFLITLAALIGTNALWIYTFSSYEYVSQDGTGVNTINTGSQEDITIGSEDEN